MVRETRASARHNDSSDTGSTVADNARAQETRRSHKKSRNGCAECKRRHIRCDERQPSCANCEVAERACFFPPPKVSKQKRRQAQKPQSQGERSQGTLERNARSPSPGSRGSSHCNTNNGANALIERAQLPSQPAHRQQSNSSELTHAPSYPSHGMPSRPADVPAAVGLGLSSHQSDQTQSPASTTQLSGTHAPPPSLDCQLGLSILGTPNAPSEAIYTPQHMILLHHAASVPYFTGPARSALDIAVRRAVDSPYLLDEILAFTAFHMVQLYPGSSAHLHDLATELQNRALSSFTRLTETVARDDKVTAVPRFLFSAILGRHVLADTLAHYRSDFKSFIDRLVECFNLNRGVKSVTLPARNFLRDTELAPVLNVILEAEKRMSTRGDECGSLKRLLNDSDLSDSSARACHEVIGLLQWCFDICRVLDEGDYAQAASSFSVKVPVGFVDMLRKHRPEALIILAHYGVLLHRCRTFWPFADAGAFIIRAVARHLGNYWQEALSWPLLVLETEP
ncbi:hypothetical protein CTAM01_15291 [Colletotrichum tamarilloi]|uniref:Zn(2)-C6 fungal-type domain-containing protein n=1 Tax=Colletotrichum tamarilloi TaxID=1209934 RepID=A0ABQ9QLT7_9PEZI|nr:uncharacterized protein CTAM01_15291 [Colletotrichum tamarilloi]KAK1476940.1 hypothetical protein CTAM01_15291 [Colletotrichum tamarilloi]